MTSTHFRVRWVSSLDLPAGVRDRKGSKRSCGCVRLAPRVSRSNPSDRLAVKSQIRFLDLAATTLKDESLGFHLAQKFDLRMGGLFYYVLASSHTLDETLQRGVRYSAIVNKGITLRLLEGKGTRINFDSAAAPHKRNSKSLEAASFKRSFQAAISLQHRRNTSRAYAGFGRALCNQSKSGNPLIDVVDVECPDFHAAASNFATFSVP